MPRPARGERRRTTGASSSVSRARAQSTERCASDWSDPGLVHAGALARHMRCDRRCRPSTAAWRDDGRVGILDEAPGRTPRISDCLMPRRRASADQSHVLRRPRSSSSAVVRASNSTTLGTAAPGSRRRVPVAASQQRGSRHSRRSVLGVDARSRQQLVQQALRLVEPSRSTGAMVDRPTSPLRPEPREAVRPALPRGQRSRAWHALLDVHR